MRCGRRWERVGVGEAMEADTMAALEEARKAKGLIQSEFRNDF